MFFLACTYTNALGQAASYNIDFGTVPDALFNSTNGTSNFFNTYTNTLANKNTYGTFYLNGGIVLPNGGSMGLVQNPAANSNLTTPYNTPYFTASMGTGSRFFMRGAPSATSSNKFAVYRYNAATTSMVFQTDFYIDEVYNSNAQGEIVFLLGNQNDNGTYTFARDNMTLNTQVQDQQIFMGMKIAIDNAATSVTYWQGSTQSWVSNPASNATAMSALTKGKHSLTIVANNNPATGTSMGKVVYTFGYTAKDLAAHRYDIYLDGVQVVSAGAICGGITSSLTLDAFCFNTGFNVNAGNLTLVLDNIKYTVNANSVFLLPVALSDFNVKELPNSGVSLSWMTGAESNNKGFRIERQSNLSAGKYDEIGFVSTKAIDGGNSATQLRYSFTDVAPVANAVNNYRLAQVDLDGKTTYSDVKSIKLGAGTVSMIFPNPSNGVVNISRSATSKKMNLQVFDLSGKVVQQFSAISDANFTLHLSKSGTYTIKMTYPETGEQSVQRIVVQK